MEQTELCDKCGAAMKISKAGKPYCSALCWMPAEQRQAPQAPAQNMSFNKPAAVPIQQSQTINKHDIVTTRAEKPHSYEFGKAGSRHKIYYGDVQELKDHLEILRAEKLIEAQIDDLEAEIKL